MHASVRRFVFAILAVAIPAGLSQWLYSNVGISGSIMLYLLAVVLASYYLPHYFAIAVSFASFFAINYLLMEPRYSFSVNNVDSIAALIGFLVVAVVITSLVSRLRQQTLQAQQAHRRAETARLLAVGLSNMQSLQQLYDFTCQRLFEETSCHCTVYSGEYAQSAEANYQPVSTFPPAVQIEADSRAIRWSCQMGKPMGPGTDNWPALPVLILPLVREQEQCAALVLQVEAGLDSEAAGAYFQFLLGLANQVAMTAQRILSQSREQTVRFAAQEESLRNALLSSIAHDMRTPLTRILGTASALQHTRNDAERDTLLQQLISEATHMAHSSERVLCLARLKSLGAGAIQKDWQSVEEICGAVMERYADEPRLQLELEAQLPLFRGDAVLLTQALLNLVENAFRYGAVAAPVRLGVKMAGDGLEFTVQNEGDPVPQQVLQHLGKKFVKGESGGSHSLPGYGLGLAIVDAVARLHGGNFSFAAVSGSGTRAVLSVPLEGGHSEA